MDRQPKAYSDPAQFVVTLFDLRFEGGEFTPLKLKSKDRRQRVGQTVAKVPFWLERQLVPAVSLFVHLALLMKLRNFFLCLSFDLCNRSIKDSKQLKTFFGHFLDRLDFGRR